MKTRSNKTILSLSVLLGLAGILVLSQCKKTEDSTPSASSTKETVSAKGNGGMGNIHFVDGPVITDNGTTLTATGRLAGLGSNSSVNIVLSAQIYVSTECTNPAGNVAPGQSRTLNVSFSGTFYSDQNGNVSFSLSTTTPSPGSCPNGQWTGRVTDVSFSNVSLSLNGNQIYP